MDENRLKILKTCAAKWFRLGLLMVMIILYACVQKPTAPVNDNPFDVQNPITRGDPFGLQAFIANGGITLTWHKPAVRILAGFHLYRSVDSDHDFKQWETFPATQSAYVDSNISNGHTYYYRLAAFAITGEETSISQMTPVTVSTRPVLVINNDAPFTNNPEVKLTVLAGAAQEMLLSDSANFDSAAWQPYASIVPWQFDAIEGSKTVYLKVRYKNGSLSETVHASVILDTSPPLAVLNVRPDSGVANETEFQFDPTQSRDNFSTTAELRIRLDIDNDDRWETGWSATDLFNRIFSMGGGTKQARLQVRDLAGNVSDTIVTFFVNARPQAQFTFIADAQNDRLFHFDASASSDFEDGSHLLYRWDWQDDGTYDTPFRTDPKADFTYPANGTYRVRLQVEDQNGLRSTVVRKVKVGYAVVFERTFGGGDFDFGNDIRQTTDGTYVLIGATKSFGAGNYDAYVIKTDANGQTIWSKTFGGEDFDVANALSLAADGFWVVGTTKSQGTGSSDIWLFKVDEQGKKILDKTFGGPNSEAGKDLDMTSDGGLIIVGNTQSWGNGKNDIWLIKTDGNARVEWSRTYGGNAEDKANKVRSTADGGFIVVGATQSFGAGDYDFWLIKTDGQGQEQWAQTFGGAGEDIAYDVRQTADGGFIVCGTTKSGEAGNLSDVWLIKTDALGQAQWKKRFGGSGTDEAYRLALAPDGGFLLVGYTDSQGSGAGDLLLIKTDVNGNQIWQKTLGGANFDKGKTLFLSPDGSLAIIGYTTSAGNGSGDVWLVKMR